MKVFLTSDWHIGNIKPDKIDHYINTLMPKKPSKTTVYVLAGDICSVHDNNFERIIKKITDKFNHVLFIPGNHDFYGGTIEDGIKKMRDLETDRIKFLYNDKITIFNRNFVGTTLWYNWRPNNNEINSKSNDFRYIKDFTPDKMYSECNAASRFLTENTHMGDIVITHHAPNRRCMSWADPEIQNGFYCDYADKIIKCNKPSWWMHGHTHMPTSYCDHKTRVVSNPLGFGAYYNYQYNKEGMYDVGCTLWS